MENAMKGLNINNEEDDVSKIQDGVECCSLIDNEEYVGKSMAPFGVQISDLGEKRYLF
ncbi:hypothetical protein Goarm_003812 [Gossypium armourianum]|uniref:Uncharacterized protein n=1 Tax=Gossypium armourianum TaxID=34283 RepID=A0A7J9K4M9_9ROSI|nr:hypothetical protein [Gossypium armourianum]